MTYYIIGGAPRSGKTTLSRRLNRETGVSVISNDALVSAMQDIFPTLGIQHGEKEHAQTSARLMPFMKAYLWLHSDWGGLPFVLDTTHIMPEQVAAEGLHEKYRVAFLGYPRIGAREKLAAIRAHATATPLGDWTREMDDAALLARIDEMTAFSRKVEEQCARHGIAFFDTSADFEGAVEGAYQYFSAR